MLRLESYMEAPQRLQQAFVAKGREFDRMLKMARTHLPPEGLIRYSPADGSGKRPVPCAA
jgi:hypothetical protein